MGKKRIIFIIIIATLIVITGLYATYATDTTEEQSLEYDMSLSFSLDGDDFGNIAVATGHTKVFDINITNPYEGEVKYGVAYSLNGLDSLPDGVIIAESSTSKTGASGVINKGETISVSIVVVNQSSANINLSFSVINGYINGGNLSDNQFSTGKTFVDSIYQIAPHNIPKLTNNLIPVYYDEIEHTWKIASYTNESNQWYDYNNKKWANAVLLTETKRNSLTKDSNGKYEPNQIIGDTEADGTLAFYVWIPRFKYKVWNINKEIGVDSYDAQNNGIDIIFETGTNTTGTIECDYRFDVTATETVRNEECIGSNGEYYTHPAFTFGDDELTGFWMGKFELSSSSPDSSNTGGADGLNLTARVLPGVRSWRHNYIDEFWNVVYNMQESNNEYGLTNRITADTHIITNLEWGAVAYLAHSEYGRCIDGVCYEVSINNSGGQDSAQNTHCFTGRSIGDSKEDYSGTYEFCGSYTYDGYDLTSEVIGEVAYCKKESTRNHVVEGTKASTTGNIYGIYDMSGGVMEYVMGNSSLQDTDTTDGITYLYNPMTVSSGSYYSYNGNEKYLTTYSYSTVHNNQTAYNRARLGDATSEVALASANYWNNDYGIIAFNSGSWVTRGGGYNSSNYRNEGVFASNASVGVASEIFGSRPSLIVY